MSDQIMESCPIIETLELAEEEYDKFIVKRGHATTKILKSKKRRKRSKHDVNKVNKIEEIQKPVDLEKNVKFENEWANYGVCNELASSLINAGFLSPTDVQKKSLASMIKLKKNSILAAETGSGKTLLYIIPIVQKCLEIKYQTDDVTQFKKLRCMILTPTRELAIQVKNMTNKISKKLGIFCVDIIGGLSEIKQERLLAKGPEIVVGTPGRLWTYIDQYPHDHLQDLTGFKLLVIDEVDRMTEEGHFQQLFRIIEFLDSKNKNYTKYIISATLSGKISKINSEEPLYKISRVMDMSQSAVHDFTVKSVIPSSLQEFKVSCSPKQMNLMLYLILKDSGKTIVFVPSIKTSDWINIFLNNLNIPTFRLNSKMDQKNRLKLFDKFNNTKAIMIATDIASRGLDFPDIDTIIHYNIPTTSDIYVHRSGRTARQSKPGKSIMFLTQDNIEYYNKIISTLNNVDHIKEFPMDINMIHKYQKIIGAYSKLTDKMLQLQKNQSTRRWYVEKSKAIDTEIDPHFVKLDTIDESTLKAIKKDIEREKNQLKFELLKIR